MEGTGVTANCVHPGLVNTDLGRDAGKFSRWLFKKMGKPPAIGAQTSVYLASAREIANVTGAYFAKKADGKASKASHDMTSIISLHFYHRWG